MSLNVIDILFLVTVAILVFNGLKNGLLFSLISLLAIPISIGVAYVFGPRFSLFLATNGWSATPLISYAILFLGTILLLHTFGNLLRRAVRVIPLVSQGDTLLGGVVGFVEAWLIWLFLLIVLGNFLDGVQNSLMAGSTLFQGVNLNLNIQQLKDWHDFYNYAVTHSIFAQVNGWFIHTLPELKNIPQPPKA